MQPNPELTPPPAASPEAPTGPQPAQQPSENKTPPVDLAITRVTGDMRFKIAEGKNETEVAKKIIFDEILREQQAIINSQVEADPIVQTAKENGWSPEAEAEAVRDPDRRIESKTLAETGIRVEAARQKHAMMTWGKFAEQSPITAAKFAGENKDVRVAIDKYKQYQYQEAQKMVRGRATELAQKDERYIAALQTNNRRVMQAVENQMRDQAMAEYIDSNPDTARFLSQSINDPLLKSAYENYVTNQEARKGELAAQAAKDGGEAGLRRLAKGPEISWEGHNVKPLEGPDISWEGMPVVNPPTTPEPIIDAPYPEELNTLKTHKNLDDPTITSDGSIASYDAGDLRIGIKPLTQEAKSAPSSTQSPEDIQITINEARDKLFNLAPLAKNSTNEERAARYAEMDLLAKKAGILGEAIWKANDGDIPVRISKYLGKGPDGRHYVQTDNPDSRGGIPLDQLIYTQNKSESISTDQTPAPETTAPTPKETGRIEPVIINGISYHPDQLPTAYQYPDGRIEYRGGMRLIKLAAREEPPLAPNTNERSSTPNNRPKTETSASTEAPKIPARERLPILAMQAGQLNLALQESINNKRPGNEINALRTKFKEANNAYNAVLDEIITEGMITNLQNEKDPKKREGDAKSIIDREEDKKKKDGLISAFVNAGLLTLAAAQASVSVAQEAA